MSEKESKQNGVLGRNIFSKEKSEDFEKAEKVVSETKISKPKKKSVFSPKRIRETKNSKKDIVALHISNKNVVVIVLHYDGISYTVKDVEIKNLKLPEVTEGTVLKDIDIDKELQILKITAINSIFEKLRLSKKNSFIVSSIAGKNVVVKQLSVSSEEYENISINLPDLMMTPFGKSITLYEHILLGTIEKDSETKYEVLGSAVENNLFVDILNILEECEIECDILELDLMSILNLYLESVIPGKGVVNCIIDIGEDISNVYIHSNGKESIFIRNLDFTFNAFRARLAKNRDISLAKAEDMIRSQRFQEFTTKSFESKTTENLNKHYSVKDYITRSLLLELTKTIQFYSRANAELVPESIFLTGKGIEMNSFSQFLSDSMEARCENMDISTFLSGDIFLKNIINDNASIVYKALGLALRID